MLIPGPNLEVQVWCFIDDAGLDEGRKIYPPTYGWSESDVTWHKSLPGANIKIKMFYRRG